jgi:hypothetical protein
MQIFVKDLSGKTITLNVNQTETINELTLKIQDRLGIPNDQMRIIFNGKSYSHNNENTLKYCKILKHCTINLILRLRGMISDFTSHDITDPLVNYLMLEDDQRKKISLSNDVLRKGLKINGYESKKTFIKLEPSDTFMTDKQRRHCISFLDAVHETEEPTLKDMKIILGIDKYGTGCEEAFLQLFNNDRNIKIQYEKIKNLHSDDGKIVFRRTEMQKGKCINFHRDGSYATKTIQMTLNDDTEYEGGRLCFITSEGLSVPSRPAGAITIHDAEVVHGVSCLHKGVRYSLFVVDKNNSLGEKILCLDKDDISRILNSKSSKRQKISSSFK